MILKVISGAEGLFEIFRGQSMLQTPHTTLKFSTFPEQVRIPNSRYTGSSSLPESDSDYFPFGFANIFDFFFVLLYDFFWTPLGNKNKMHTTIYMPHIVHIFSLLLCFVFEFEFVRVVLCYAIGGNVSYEVLNYKTPKCAPSEHAHTQILTLPDTETYTHR